MTKKTIGFVSDLHVGNQCSIMPPVVVEGVFGGREEHEQNDLQKMLYGYWKKKFMSSVFVTEDLNLNRKDCDEIRTDKVIRDRGKMVLTHRPWIKEWSAKTTIRFNDGIGLTPKKLKDILIYAGERQGLLSYRPKFGRFEVTGFNVLD